jgi:trans-aconitate 2-methyltransferase
MIDWNPDLYLKFRSERTQPAMDLISRVNHVKPGAIIDIGCGPGNSTQVLANRWPKAWITGLDRSAAMIRKARQDYPDQEWIVADALTYASDLPYDLVFSNAAIQWIPDHERLLRIFHGLLSPHGTLAVQLPLFWDMPLGKLLHGISRADRWRRKTEGVYELFTMHEASFYYDRLSALFPSVEIWETHYIHIMDGHLSILEMMRSTGLRPYLERLAGEAERQDFEMQVLEGIGKAYPVQADGKVLFPFNRLFFIGSKSVR